MPPCCAARLVWGERRGGKCRRKITPWSPSFNAGIHQRLIPLRANLHARAGTRINDCVRIQHDYRDAFHSPCWARAQAPKLIRSFACALPRQLRADGREMRAPDRLCLAIRMGALRPATRRPCFNAYEQRRCRAARRTWTSLNRAVIWRVWFVRLYVDI